jgi:hypothetical protein
MAGRKCNNRSGNGNARAKTVTPEKKVAVMEFTPHIAGKHQAVTYDTVKEHILQEIQKDLKHGYDIARCLREGLNKGIPILKSTREIEVQGGSLTEQEVKLIQEGYDMEWQIEYKEYSARKNVYDENIYKTYAIIFGYCNKAMQTRIEETSEFEAKIRNDLWEILSTIKLRMYGQV